MMSLFLSRDMAKQLMFLLLCFYIGGCNAGVVPGSFRQHGNDIMSMTLEQPKVENTSVGDAVPISGTRIQENDTPVKAKSTASLPQPSLVNSSSLLNSNGGKNSPELDSGVLQIPALSTLRINVTGNVSKGSEVASNQQSGIKSSSMNSSGLLSSNTGNNSFELEARNVPIPALSNVRLNITGNVLKESEPVSEQLSGIELSLVNSSGLLNLNGGNNLSELDSRSLVIPSLSTAGPNVTGNAIEVSEVVSNQLTGNFDTDEDKIKLDDDSGLAPISTSVFHLNQSELSNVNDAFTSNNTDSVSVGDIRPFGEVSNETDVLFQSEGPEKSLNEIGGSKIHLNESNLSISLSLLPNETESNDLEFSGKISETIDETNGSSVHIAVGNAESGTSGELESLATENISEGLFSIFGFELLKNSEVAKNAAMAMEVFNLTDSSITDHIIEDNEFHGFLDLVVPTSDDLNLNSTSEPLVVLNSTTENLNSSERFEENNKNNTLHVTNMMETETNPPDLVLNSTELKNVNEALELTNITEHTEERNETLISNISTIVNGTDFTESSVIEQDSNNTSTVVPRCPPPGFCLFWFLSQDTCAVNSHCLGSRICCRIRCSKTCIEIP